MQETIHPDSLGRPPPPPPPPPPKEKVDGVFSQLADAGRLALGLPVYKKVREIGRGAFGKAYLVETVRTGKHAKKAGNTEVNTYRVLKKLPLTDIPDVQREATFREAQFMRKISRGCPYITQFSEVLLCKGGTVLCLVMEFCSGGDFRQFLHSRKDSDGGMQLLTEGEVLGFVSQIGLALHHCHVNGILHRDVKPENCFFRSPGGDLLLGDFGISCALDDKHFAKTCVGSPLYLSPEIVNQETYSYSSDVWSFGVMLYETAMLEPPFKGSNICQLAFRIVGSTPQPLHAHYSESLQVLVSTLLAKTPSDRPTLREALESDLVTPFVASAAKKHGLSWPLEDIASTSRSFGLVQRLRRHVAGTADAEADVYADDFEIFEEDGDCDYKDDFEDVSNASDASYEQDFELPSDDDNDHSSQLPTILEESEESFMQQIYDELASGSVDRQEVVSFLEGMRRSFIAGHHV